MEGLPSRHFKGALLELGGKAPFLVLDDADLDAAVQATAFGAFFNQGKVCMSTARTNVDEPVVDEFVASLSAKVATLIAGDPTKPGFIPTSMVSDEAAAKIAALTQ